MGVSGLPSWKPAEIGLFLPFSYHFLHFSGGPEQPLENPENGGKRPFPQMSLDLLTPHLLLWEFQGQHDQGQQGPQP